jgi:hypothetical protein
VLSLQLLLLMDNQAPVAVHHQQLLLLMDNQARVAVQHQQHRHRHRQQAVPAAC